jgi:cytoskeletal protein RodZ
LSDIEKKKKPSKNEEVKLRGVTIDKEKNNSD